MGSPTVAIIPARFASTRLPGKPLIKLDGVPMVVRVADRVRAARRMDLVCVATDDERIAEVVVAAGHRAIMTPSDCASGTDRVHRALERIEVEPGLVINVQGDEPLIDPADIDALAAAMEVSQAGMGTLVRPLQDAARFRDPNVVKVVVGADGNALYFSRAPIPHGADPDDRTKDAPLQHVGLYAYRPEVLGILARVPPSPLERQERLEQLRALEHGIPIHVAWCASLEPSIAIDTPEDVDKVVRLLSKEGSKVSHGER